MKLIQFFFAYETFVLCAAIVHGLLQFVALRFGTEVWQHHTLYLRTRSRSLPLEKNVRQVLTPLVAAQLVHLPPDGIIAKIHRYFKNKIQSVGGGTPPPNKL